MRRALLGAMLIAALALGGATDALAQAGQVGPSGLPLPRFVSLKSDRVNVRQGPGDNYRVAWIFVRKGLPVEVTQEFENWRRIRDSDGAEGWIFQSLLSGERTAVVSPWDSGPPVPIRSGPSAADEVSAYLEPGVLANVDECSGGWCRLSGTGYRGWIQQDRLWGVYPNEVID